jgi:phosphate transport system permease protein
MLGLGRALGETIAVIMLIGNNTNVTANLFSRGVTIPAHIAGTFGEAGTKGFERSQLVTLALVLIVLTLGFAALARLLVRKANRRARAAISLGAAA